MSRWSQRGTQDQAVTRPSPTSATRGRRVRSFRTVPARLPGAEHDPNRSSHRLRWLLVGLFIVIALPVFVLTGAWGWMRLSQTVAPGVTVGNVPVGGLKFDKAVAALDYAWNQEYVITAVDTSDAGRVWAVAPAQLGLAVDTRASAEQALQYGRSFPAGIIEMVNGLSAGWEVAPIVTFDEAAAAAGLESLSVSAYLPASNAQLGLAAGAVTSTPARWGSQVDVEASLALLAANPEAVLLEFGFAPLVTHALQPDIEEVATAAAAAEQLLGSPPTLRAYDPVDDEWFEWTPSRDEASAWLRVQRDGGSLSVAVHEEAVRAYVQRLQPALGEERMIDISAATASLVAGLEGNETEPLRIHYLPRYYIVSPQDTLISISFKVGIPYWRWLESNPQVSARGLVVGESLTIPGRDSMLELPVITDKRIVISISEQRMWLYENGEMILHHIVSTGIPNSPTMPGLFQVKSHYADAYASNWDLYMPNFLGIYHATPNLLNGIHGLPLLSNGVRLWADVLGSPASYGCVILDLEAAERLFTWADDGVVVEIQA